MFEGYDLMHWYMHAPVQLPQYREHIYQLQQFPWASL